MLVKAFLLRAIDTLSSSTRHCGASPTYLGCDLAARGYSKYHLSRYLRNLLFSPVNRRMNVQLNIAASDNSGDATLTRLCGRGRSI